MSKGTGTLYRVDGTRRTLTEKPDLAMAQALVGGYVQVVQVKDGQLLVNEDGLLVTPPLRTNLQATVWCMGRVHLDQKRGIVGDAVLLTGDWKWD
jgi:hypothetical protein